MTRKDIEECFESTEQEVLDEFIVEFEKKVKNKLEELEKSGTKISASHMAMFAYTHAITSSVKINTEINKNVLTKLLVDEK